MTERPNIVIFLPETVRADAIYEAPGAGAHTPNFDRLRSEGVTFTQAWAQMAYCTPSRCSMFTGRYPHTHGHRSIWHLLQPGERNLFQDLKEGGYRNVVFGKNDLIDETFAGECFDEWHLRIAPDRGTVRYEDSPTAERLNSAMYLGRREGECHDADWARIQSALDFLDEDHEQPWCLFLPLSFAHPWYAVEEPFFSMHDRDALPTPIPPVSGDPTRAYRSLYRDFAFPNGLGEADLREIKGAYYGMVSRMDAQFGQILDRLSERGLEDDTIVLALSDHGDYAGDYGMVEKCPYGFEECLLRVPLIFRVPGVEPREVDGLCEMTDLYATMMDLVGLEPKHHQFGRSLAPAISGDVDTLRGAVFAEGGRLPGEEQWGIEGLAPDNWYAKRRDVVNQNPEVNLSRCAMVRTSDFAYTYCANDADELFDLRDDSDATMNVAENALYDEVRSELRDRLLSWMLDTSDTLPLQQGSRHWPAG
ncbi:MAG: sulfatase-like hydrolase/transferase [candidate division WS1 bacterium]|jgi:arylsulfatase A-like enzyme|nr:sulfatase-like hydrolase/transferase [candidate division WS1 bacterium]